jgi:hypothetical protein
VGEFKTDPIDNFQHKKICVLTDKPGRVFLETDQSARAFGNVWVPKDAIIFKGSRITFSSSFHFFNDILLDVCGKLEGESIVQASIQGEPDSWYLEEPPLSPTSPPEVSPNRSSPSPNMTASPTNSVADGPFQDWREPFRQGLVSPDANVRIWAPSPTNSNPCSPAPASPTTSGGSSVRDGSPLSVLPIPAQSPAHTRRRSARPTLASQRLPLVSQRRTAPPSPTILPVPSPQQPPIVASPLKDRATPISIPAPPTAPASCDVSRRLESQDGALTRDSGISLQKADMRSPPPILTVTVTSQSGVPNPQKLVIGGAIECRDKPGKADLHNPEEKGAASLAPDSDSTPGQLQARGGRVRRLPAFQYWFQKCNEYFGK